MKSKENKIDGLNIEQLSDAELAALVFDKVKDRELFPEKVERGKKSLESFAKSEHLKSFFK